MDYELTKTSLGTVSYRKLGSGKRKVLFFHGFPGSSAQLGMFRPVLESLDIEVLCFDRPGYNATTITTPDSLRDSTIITDELTKQMNWDCFEIVTVSGGTPFGITYAKRHPDKVTCIRVICGLGNFSVPAVKKVFPPLSILGLRVLPRIPGTVIQKALSINPAQSRKNIFIAFFLPASKPDADIFQNPSVLSSLNVALSEALSQKALGPRQDAHAFLKNWSHDSENMKVPVHFWHGDLDHVISDKVSTAMYSLFPNSGITIVPGEGHISLPISHVNAILSKALSSEKTF